MCQGLLPNRRHIEKREDPGDEVDVMGARQGMWDKWIDIPDKIPHVKKFSLGWDPTLEWLDSTSQFYMDN